MGFAAGFSVGQNAVERGLKMRDERKRREELQEVANAKPEESTGYTAEQGAELEAAAQSGQYDIGIKTKDDGSFDSYTVTPKADPTQNGNVAMQGVTDFMGKRTAGSMNEGQVDRARSMAMAGVLEKYDPLEGMRMRQAVKTQDRDDQRFDRQTQDWKREDDDRAKKDAYEAEKKTAFESSRFGQGQATYQKQMQEFQAKQEKYEAAKASGKSGPELGVAPVSPTRPEYSIGDALADRAALIDLEAKNGRLDPKTFGEFTDMLNKVQSEGYEKVLRLAQSGAALPEVAQAFNASGKVQFDPAAVVSDKMVKGKDGVETRVIQFKDEDGTVRTINALAELDSMGKAADVFTRHFQKKQDQRADNAEGRAVSAAAQSKQENAARTNAAVALFKERNPNATAAEISAVRSGILDATPSADKNAPSEVKLAKAMVDSGLAPDLRSGLEMAITKKSQSAKEAYLDLMKPQGGIAPREEDVAVVMQTAFGDDWRGKVGGAGAAAGGKNPPKVNSPADLAKLEKGTKYTAPDGTVRVKQ
jgi:hypothetical protein